MTGFLIVILVTLFVVFLFLCFLLLPDKPGNEQVKPFYHRNIAHRGLHTKDKLIPENSMAAFQQAIIHNYGIELDVQFTKDFQVVVFHDSTLNRVCGINGRVDEYTYEQLQKFSLCQSKERIPRFEDVLKMVNGRVPLIVELKTGKHNKQLCEMVYTMLEQYEGAFCIESFDPTIVRWFKLHAPSIYRGQLSASSASMKKELDVLKRFFLSTCFLNFIGRPNFIAYEKNKAPWTVRLAYSLGAIPVVWTVCDNDPIRQIEQKNQTVIFEFYHPTSYFD